MGERDRDEESGKFTEEYPPQEFLEALSEIGPSGTTDISDHIGCDRRTAYLKLKSLEEEGKVRSKKVGNSLLWELDE
ncbi:transcriptional regulator [Salarchaeum sp. JOR-1]|uniref:transcriptional regulator n=1 Tax=Salarchaeum sp. JOR-1 TaxID=2599399 RepID=UPI001198A9BC|nr:transcriptional regulator [Salarchaeum sp. JOR-1]QDX41177.1 transcriptional regulator [Salarchaeum sp. JOR-1]